MGLYILCYQDFSLFFFYMLGSFNEEVLVDHHLLGFWGYFLHHEIQLLLLLVSYYVWFGMVLHHHFHGLLDMMESTQEVIDS